MDTNGRTNSRQASEKLRQFRQSLERGDIGPGDSMPVALVLADVCDALTLTYAEKRDALGWNWRRWIMEWGDEPMTLATAPGGQPGNSECPMAVTIEHSEQAQH